MNNFELRAMPQAYIASTTKNKERLVLRDTDYATELGTVSISDNTGQESRLERLLIKSSGEEEIRFSWWVDGSMRVRPLDLPEDELAKLLAMGFAEGVLSPFFLAKLHQELAVYTASGSEIGG